MISDFELMDMVMKVPTLILYVWSRTEINVSTINFLIIECGPQKEKKNYNRLFSNWTMINHLSPIANYIVIMFDILHYSLFIHLWKYNRISRMPFLDENFLSFYLACLEACCWRWLLNDQVHSHTTAAWDNYFANKNISLYKIVL